MEVIQYKVDRFSSYAAVILTNLMINFQDDFQNEDRNKLLSDLIENFEYPYKHDVLK